MKEEIVSKYLNYFKIVSPDGTVQFAEIKEHNNGIYTSYPITLNKETGIFESEIVWKVG